jgi:DNA-binding LacI/PurR family transcriptional regulator
MKFKYTEIEKKLRNAIISGEISDALPPERELAERFGVSYVTVRRAIGNLVESGLLSREHGRGVFVNSPSRGTLKNYGIGFIVPERTIGREGRLSPYYTEVFMGAVHEAQKYGYHVIFDSHLERLLPYNQSGGVRKVDAIMAVTPDFPEIFAEAAKYVPVIMLGHDCPKMNYPTVYVDDVQAARKAVNYLIKCGHRRIAHWAGCNDSMSFYSRRIGYRQALEEHAIRLDSTLELGAGDGYEKFADLLQKQVAPTAIFCVNDARALGVLDWCQRHGVEVPEDLSIVGIDNMLYSGLRYPALTTVNIPKYEIGMRGVRKAIKFIEQKLLPEDYREEIKTEIIKRETVKDLSP